MQFVKGINFAPFSPRGELATPAALAELRRMRELTGANTVIFCPAAVQATAFTDTLDYTGPHTTGDDELLAITAYAQQLELRVFWKPTLNCLDGTWRAHINFFDHPVPGETNWQTWFDGYRAFQQHFAALAQKAGVELFILGCEMTQTERREQDYRTLIAAVRAEYAGPLAYNCDKYGEEFVPWWDAVDVIASSGYYPLHDIDAELNRIESTVKRYGKPFFFAEAGCMRVQGSAARPNDWTLQNARDDAEQAAWYQALFSACKSRTWFDGYGLWDWPVRENSHNHYSFDAHPALVTVKKAFGAEQYHDAN